MLIDPRIGSGDLEKPLRNLGVKPVTLQKLEAGDVAFCGRGPGGMPHTVGIELKRASEVLDVILSARLAGRQLVNMQESYDEIWVCVEGNWRANQYGVLELQHPKGYWFEPRGRRWMFRDVQQYLISVGRIARLWHTSSHEETIQWIAAQWHWWTDKAYDEHSTLKTFVDYKGRAVGDPKEPKTAMLQRPTFERRVAKEIEGVGWERSIEVVQAFETVASMVAATEADWRKVPGIGPKIAADARAQLHGTYKEDGSHRQQIGKRKRAGRHAHEEKDTPCTEPSR
jgi:ERCC4-type nuclease